MQRMAMQNMCSMAVPAQQRHAVQATLSRKTATESLHAARLARLQKVTQSNMKLASNLQMVQQLATFVAAPLAATGMQAWPALGIVVCNSLPVKIMQACISNRHGMAQRIDEKLPRALGGTLA
jgi:hypothetical protein